MRIKNINGEKGEIMNPTDKQLSMIDYLSKHYELREVIERIPKNNERHPDERCNCRGAIITDYVKENLSRYEASCLIERMMKEDLLSLESLFKRYGLIK